MQYPYDHSYGYRNRSKAEEGLEHALASGDIQPGERPEIHSYRVPAENGGYRLCYRITLHG